MDRSSKVNAPGLDFGIVVGLAYNGFVLELREALERGGFADLHPWAGYVLRVIEQGPLNLLALAAELGMTSQGAIKIVDRLAAEGYVSRVVDPADARVRQITLSPRGRELLEAAHAFHRAYEARLRARFGAADVSRAMEVLNHMAATVPDREGRRALRPL